MEEIQVIKDALEEIDAKLIEGIVIRSQLRWSEKWEKRNKYFLGLEKRNSRRKHCKKLITDEGREIINPNDVLTEQKDFYHKLYESNLDGNTDIENNVFFQDNKIPVLSEDDMLLCEGQLTNVECYDALKKMSNNKSPGNDRFSSE